MMRYDSNDAIGWYDDSNNKLLTFRTNGPSYITHHGCVFFAQHRCEVSSRRHGPSTIYPDGLLRFTDPSGYLHRIDGPAVIDHDTVYYVVEGRTMTMDEFFLTYGRS